MRTDANAVPDGVDISTVEYGLECTDLEAFPNAFGAIAVAMAPDGITVTAHLPGGERREVGTSLRALVGSHALVVDGAPGPWFSGGRLTHHGDHVAVDGDPPLVGTREDVRRTLEVLLADAFRSMDAHGLDTRAALRRYVGRPGADPVGLYERLDGV